MIFNLFTGTLYKQGILPLWSIKWVSKIFPWIEIGLSLLLTAGFLEKLVSFLVVSLFVIFLSIKLTLFFKKAHVSCGCNSQSTSEVVDGVSIFVAIIYIALSTFHMILAVLNTPISIFWHLVESGCIILLWSLLLIGCIIHYKRQLKINPQEVEVTSQKPVFFFRDEEGNTLTIIDY
ncbi:hypothetical protein EPA93_11470 [Ktedonosporobacter rubrisoli]|uniref:Methylamine utilisation protein MauE domain-containing protein n=1 Tax=Ktedonosporobacter rubrisoli TaxID=2509675 RepID=A0A4P6JMS8_KTERU|nr:hypothetical protein EPA93_11470 [Ktedonosporobacter rubrisoli]